MIELSLGEVADVVGARLLHADPGTRVTGPVEYDSRRPAPGGIFLALPGERVDGHDYAAAAVAAGAVAVLGTRDTGVPTLLVEDGVTALSALAAHVVRRADATVVGITGSSGKTSTKDLIAQVLATAGPTVAARGSANNELGFPYTVLQVAAATRFLVLELGARGVGHIRHLTELAPLDIAAVLNVGSAHLGEFGSRAAIAEAKGELIEGLRPDGVAVLNADDPLVSAMRSRTRARIVTFAVAEGTEPATDVDVSASGIELDELDRARFVLHHGDEAAPVRLQVAGRHQVANAAATAAVALRCGLDVESIAAALSAARASSPWRMEITERPDGVTIINDAYNANPESMAAAVAALARVGIARPGSRTFAVLGPMAELGPDAEAEHVRLGERLVAAGITRVVAVGPAARPIVTGAGSAESGDARAVAVEDRAAAVALLRGELRSGDVVLVKASRAASLEQVALAIAQDDSRDEQKEAGTG